MQGSSASNGRVKNNCRRAKWRRAPRDGRLAARLVLAVKHIIRGGSKRGLDVVGLDLRPKGFNPQRESSSNAHCPRVPIRYLFPSRSFSPLSPSWLSLLRAAIGRLAFSSVLGGRRSRRRRSIRLDSRQHLVGEQRQRAARVQPLLRRGTRRGLLLLRGIRGDPFVLCSLLRRPSVLVAFILVVGHVLPINRVDSERLRPPRLNVEGELSRGRDGFRLCFVPSPLRRFTARRIGP
mmetsp:Transcript_35951/g.107436  ORF Transcript_35951/g.107436 Transcript_35951/m.107436 type:complete len:235 (-) Transcript_35951:126-830(-)